MKLNGALWISYREYGHISHSVDDVIGVNWYNDTCRITTRSQWKIAKSFNLAE